MTKHVNGRTCDRCEELIAKYPGIYPPIYAWYVSMKDSYPEFHISCAGRGKTDQEAAFASGHSRAHYGQSAHNVNAAFDVFRNVGDIYDKAWFARVIEPNVRTWMVWYGAPGAKYPELPHLEVRNWKELLADGTLKLVEST